MSRRLDVTGRMKPFDAKGATRKALLKAGYLIAEDVETWRGGYKYDFIGFGDVLAYHPAKGLLLVQATVAEHLADHIKKAFAEPKVARWLGWGFRAEIWSYPRREDREDGDMEPVVIDMKPTIDKGKDAR